jgi:Domain of unknown function (DUF4399)
MTSGKADNNCLAIFPLPSTSLRKTARRADPLEKLCNPKQPLNASAVRPNPVKPRLSASLVRIRIQYNARRGQIARQAGRTGAMLFSVCSRIRLFIVLIIGGLTIAAGETARPPNASVYIISPKDGDTVTSPFRVQFGLSGMGVAPAGVDAPNTGGTCKIERGSRSDSYSYCIRFRFDSRKKGFCKRLTGHQHLLIDVNEELDPNEPIPQDKHHLHFGAGKTEALIELPPGKHTLQLVSARPALL